MAETAHTPSRQHIHRRNIEIDAFLRDDGLWDVEGILCDVRDDDFEFVWGTRFAGHPIHRMQLTLTLDQNLLICNADARLLAMPYVGICELIATRYASLAGLTIGRGFRQQVNAMFGDIKGCTHVSHLVQAMASAAYQSVVRPPGMPPKISEFAINGCHALSTEGEVVRVYRSSPPDSRGQST